MSQKQLWNSKWKNIYKQLPRTSFAKRTFEFIKDKKIKTVLELGCGDGKDSIYFAKKGFEITAVDISEEGISMLWQRINKNNFPNIKTIVKDTREIDFPENSFDMIYANLSLHYFSQKDNQKIFENLYQMLKKGGFIFIKVKSTKDSLMNKGTKLEKDFFLQDGKEHRFFSKDSLKDCLKSFEIIKIRNNTQKMRTFEGVIKKSKFLELIARK